MIADVVRGMRKTWWRGAFFVLVLPSVSWAAAVWRCMPHPLASLWLAPIGVVVWAYNGWLEATRGR